MCKLLNCCYASGFVGVILGPTQIFSVVFLFHWTIAEGHPCKLSKRSQLPLPHGLRQQINFFPSCSAVLETTWFILWKPVKAAAKTSWTRKLQCLSWSQSSSDRQWVHMGDLDAKRYPWYPGARKHHLCLNLSWNRDSRFLAQKEMSNQQAYFPKSKLVQAGPSWSKMVQAASLSTWASLTSLQVGIFALAGRIPPCGHQLTSLKSLPRLPSEDSLKGDRWQAVTGSDRW